MPVISEPKFHFRGAKVSSTARSWGFVIYHTSREVSFESCCDRFAAVFWFNGVMGYVVHSRIIMVRRDEDTLFIIAAAQVLKVRVDAAFLHSPRLPHPVFVRNASRRSVDKVAQMG